MNPITLTISTGRCGTTFLEKSFKANFSREPNWISHEHLRQDVTNVGVFHRCYSLECQQGMANKQITDLINRWVDISKAGPVVDFGWTMRSLIPYLYRQIGGQLRVLHLHRHPVSVAASFKLIGSYSLYHSPQWAITPSHPRAMFPQFSERWPSMTAFEKCLYLWLEVNASAIELKDKYPDLHFLQVSSDTLFSGDEALEAIARFTGFLKDDFQLKRSEEQNRTDIFSLERRPIENEWTNYERHPEIVNFAKSLGYNMDRAYIAKLIPKYQLPKGILPLIRNKSGYWAHKENIGKFLRKFGLTGQAIE